MPKYRGGNSTDGFEQQSEVMRSIFLDFFNKSFVYTYCSSLGVHLRRLGSTGSGCRTGEGATSYDR